MNWFTEIVKSLWDFFVDILKGPVSIPDPIQVPVPAPIPPPKPVPPTKTGAERLYETARTYLGTDASPRDQVDDDIACVETFENIHFHAFGLYLNGTNFKPVFSTIDAYKYFLNNPKWRATLEAKPGNAIICVSGKGNGTFWHGHIGIFGENEKIMSNTSKDGIFRENYTLPIWVDRFRVQGGFIVYMFGRVD